MIKLNPPFPLLKIGMLRSIELFNSNECKQRTSEFKYLENTERVQNIFGSPPSYLVIGLVDNSQPIMVDKDQVIQGVFVDSILDKTELRKVAESIEKLYKIVILLHEVWRGKENEISLEKSAFNLDSRDYILSQISFENPSIEINFWNYQAFRELDIKMY
jgi:hypothetical protein